METYQTNNGHVFDWFGKEDSHKHKVLKYRKGQADLNRGHRNNNLLNIRTTGDRWNGMIGTDGAFVIFDSEVMGVRAALIILKNYIKRGIDTIEEIISTWAPAKDGNNTPGYIAAVEKAVGIPRNVKVDMSNPDIIYKMVHEMGRKECSADISRAMFDKAVALMK